MHKVEEISASEKEGNSILYNGMNENWGYCVKKNKPITKRQIPHHSVYEKYLN
jgi:hypothetical protein